jgi:hypothetical protein
VFFKSVLSGASEMARQISHEAEKLKSHVEVLAAAQRATSELDRSIFREKLYIETALERAKSDRALTARLKAKGIDRRKYDANVERLRRELGWGGDKESAVAQSPFALPCFAPPIGEQDPRINTAVESRIERLKLERNAFLLAVSGELSREQLSVPFGRKLEELVSPADATLILQQIYPGSVCGSPGGRILDCD